MTETTSNDCPSCAGVPAQANPDEGGIANAKNNNNPVGNIAIAAGGLFFVTFFGQTKKEMKKTTSY